ncbi:hypothetical protein Cco03nite_59390 [Catellatospora coxensis]|uniref:Uncharacterized protein n=3 Tax=Catellatospora coxensis TaxID=310354 RepID=A0A8J3L0Z4_9ACTN|nr:hypothetical protein Cco03nite_59390 [Catellatospora coxensis]
MSQTFFRRLVTSVVVGIGLQVGLDVAIQFTQLYITGTRHSWDGRRTGGAALSGLIGGVVGPVVFEGLSRAFTRALGPRFGDDVGERIVTSLPGLAGTGALTEFSAEQLADVILNGRIQQSDHPWAPASAGAVEGAVDWIGQRTRPRGGAIVGLDGGVGDLGLAGDGPPGGGLPDPDTAGDGAGPKARPEGHEVVRAHVVLSATADLPERPPTGAVSVGGTPTPRDGAGRTGVFTGVNRSEGGGVDARRGSRDGDGPTAADVRDDGGSGRRPSLSGGSTPERAPLAGARPTATGPVTAAPAGGAGPAVAAGPAGGGGRPAPQANATTGPIVAERDVAITRTAPSTGPAATDAPAGAVPRQSTATAATDTPVGAEPRRSTAVPTVAAQLSAAPGPQAQVTVPPDHGSATVPPQTASQSGSTVQVRDWAAPAHGWRAVSEGFAHPGERILITTDGRWVRGLTGLSETAGAAAALVRADLFGLYFAGDGTVAHVPLRGDQAGVGVADGGPAGPGHRAGDQESTATPAEGELSAESVAELVGHAVVEQGRVVFAGPDPAADRLSPVPPGQVTTRVVAHVRDGLVRVAGSVLTAGQFAQVLAALPDGALADRVELVNRAPAGTAGPLAATVAAALDRTVIGADTQVWSAVGPGMPGWSWAAGASTDAAGRLRPRLGPDGTPDGDFVLHVPHRDGGVDTRRLGSTLTSAGAEGDMSVIDNTPGAGRGPLVAARPAPVASMDGVLPRTLVDELLADAVIAPGKVLFPGPNRAADLAAARWIPPGAGTVRVLVHARDGLVQVGGRTLTAAQFAQLLQGLSAGTVELISCNATGTAGSLAGNLAVLLGRTVIGADTPVWTAVGPGMPAWTRAVAASIDPAGRMRPRLAPDGSPDGRFVAHLPDGAGGVRTVELGGTLDARPAVTSGAAAGRPSHRADGEPGGSPAAVTPAWHPWLPAADAYGPARPTPPMLSEPGVIGGQNVPVHEIVDEGGALRSRVVRHLVAAAPHGWDEAAISAAVERQLSDTALLDNNKPLFNGSGWAVTLGSGRDAVELRLRAVAGERAQAASFDGSAATADPMSAGGSPDRRTPQRTFVDTTLGENSTGGATIAVGYSALAGFDTATPYVTATPLGAVSVQAGTSTARGQSAQTRLRTNEEITLPVAGDDPAQARAWRTTAQVTVSVSRRGVADTRVTGGVRVTVSALNALTSLSDVPAVRRGPAAREWRLPPSAVLETASVPANLFDDLALGGRLPVGFRKPGSAHRAELADLVDADNLGLNRARLVGEGLSTSKITSRRGEATPWWKRPVTRTRRGFVTLTATVGAPVLMFNPLALPGRTESALRTGASDSTSHSHESMARVQGSAGAGVAFGENPQDGLEHGLVNVSAVGAVERGSGSSSSTETGTQTEVKSKATGEMLLYRVPLELSAQEHVGPTAHETRPIGSGPAYVYLWVTPLDAARFGYPGAAAPRPPHGPIPASPLPPRVGDWQPMALPDVREIGTTAADGERLWDRVLRTVDAIGEPDLLPRQGAVPTRRQVSNLEALQKAVTQSHLRGNWRTLLESGIRVSLERPDNAEHDAVTSSRHVSVVIKAKLTDRLTRRDGIVDGTQLEQTTRVAHGHTEGHSVSLGGRAGAQAQLGMSTGHPSRERTRLRAFLVRLSAMMFWKHQRTLSGGDAPATAHLVKVDRRLHEHQAGLSFTVHAEYAERPRTLNAPLRPVRDRHIIVGDGLPPLTVPDAFRVGLPEFDQVHALTLSGGRPRVELVDSVHAATPQAVSITGPHQFLDVHVPDDALFTAADIALGAEVTVDEPPAGVPSPAVPPLPVRGPVGMFWTSWRESGPVPSTSGRTYRYESTALTEPGSPAETAIRGRITPDAIRSALDLNQRGGGAAKVMRGGTFTDIVGDLTMTVRLVNPRRALSADTGYNIYDSAEFTEKSDTGRRTESGQDLTVGVHTNNEVVPTDPDDPRSVHRLNVTPQAGYSKRTGKREEGENTHTVARREVVENEAGTAMLGDLHITFTGGVSAPGMNPSPGSPELSVRVVAPDSALFLVTEAEADRLTVPLGKPAPAAGVVMALPPPYLTKMVGLGVVHGAVSPRAVAPAEKDGGWRSLQDRFARSLPADMPDLLRGRAARVAADLLELHRLKPTIDGLYDRGLPDTFTVDGWLYRDEVKVQVNAMAVDHQAALHQPPAPLRASLFTAATTSRKWQQLRQRVFGVGVPVVWSGMTRLTTGDGDGTGLQSVPTGASAALSLVRNQVQQRTTSQTASGYVEKSGPLTGIDVDHSYQVTVTRQRVSTALGKALLVGVVTHFMDAVRRTVWQGSWVRQQRAVTLAVPVDAVNRAPGLANKLARIGHHEVRRHEPGDDSPPDRVYAPVDHGPWALPPGTSYSLEGAVAGAALHDAVTEAFTQDGSVPRMLRDYATDLVLDRITGGATMAARVRTMLDGRLRTGDLFDDSGLRVKVGGFSVTARLHGRPLLVHTSSTVEQEAQQETGEVERESGSSGVDFNAGNAGLQHGQAIGSQPATDTPREALDWQPNNLHYEGGMSSGGRDTTMSGQGVSGGPKIKQKGWSGVYSADLVLYVEPGQDGKHLPVVEERLTLRPRSVQVEKGALVRFWEGDVRALGMYGWRERLGDPVDLAEVAVDAGTHLEVRAGRLHLVPGAGDPVGDLTDLPSDSAAALVVASGVTDTQVQAFLAGLPQGSAPPVLRADGHDHAAAVSLAALTGIPVDTADGVRVVPPTGDGGPLEGAARRRPSALPPVLAAHAELLTTTEAFQHADQALLDATAAVAERAERQRAEQLRALTGAIEAARHAVAGTAPALAAADTTTVGSAGHRMGEILTDARSQLDTLRRTGRSDSASGGLSIGRREQAGPAGAGPAADTAPGRAADRVGAALADWDSARQRLHAAVTAAPVAVDTARTALADLDAAFGAAGQAVAELRSAVKGQSPLAGQQQPSVIVDRNRALIRLGKAAATLAEHLPTLLGGLDRAALATALDELAAANQALTEGPSTPPVDADLAAERVRREHDRRAAFAAWRHALDTFSATLAELLK